MERKCGGGPSLNSCPSPVRPGSKREGNKKKFWKGINEVRKGESLRSLSMRNSMGEELTQKNDIEVDGKSSL